MTVRRRDDGERVIVIGGGLGSLAAACTLAARGVPVTLLERNDWLGGKAAVWEEAGFRFDMGPTILILPSVLRRLFAEAGERLEDHLDLAPLDPQWRCFFADGSTLDLEREVAAMATALERFAPGAGSEWESFVSFSARLHEVSERYFLWRSVGSIADTFDPGATFRLSTLADLAALRMGRTVAGSVRSRLSDPRVAQLADHFTQYVGSAPDASPAVLCGIAHMQLGEGVWYPRGGIGAVPRALAALARRLGVEVRTGVGVRRVLTANRGRRPAVVGVETEDGERLAALAVVSGADAVRTHRELLDGAVARRWRRRGFQPACSGVVLYLGLSRRYEHLGHHDFAFSADPEEEIDAVYRRGVPAEDPTCYLCAPAASDPAVAPAGGEALYVLVHAPALGPGHDWRRDFPRYRRTILDKLARTAGLEDLEERIVVERALTPEDIHRRYGVLDGAIYGLASHGRFLGAFKPANRSREVDGLYLAGGAAHPGPGMPMVMMSGWIAGDCAARDLGVGGAAAASGEAAGAEDVPAFEAEVRAAS